MRSCVQILLKPLLRAETPTVELGLAPLPDVPPVVPGCGEPLFDVVEALLRYHGVETDPIWLMGVSGAAFRLAWRSDLVCCPSALHVYDSDPFDTVGRAVGVAWRRRGGLTFERALQLVRRQLALGRPVLTSGLQTAAEWTLVVGIGSLEYRPGRWHNDPLVPTVGLTTRSRADDGGRYTNVVANPWSGYSPGPPGHRLWCRTPLVWIEHACQPAEPGQVLRDALQRAVGADGAGWGPYVCGVAAYRAWIELLRADPAADDLREAELQRRAWANAFIAERLSAARTDAVRFLEAAAGELASRPARRLLALAAREYETVADGLAGVAGRFRPDGVPALGAYLDGAVREQSVTQLGQCYRAEKLALGYLAKALGRLG